MPVGAGLATAATGFLGASSAAKASKKATQAAVAQQEKTRALVQPYVGAGTDALGTISDPNRMMAAFKVDPGYNFRMSEGINALNTNKAAAGLLRSGSTLKDTVGYGQNLASAEYEKVYNRLFNRAQMGLNAAGVSAGANNQAGAAYLQQGTDQGNAMLSMGNSVASGIGSIARAYAPATSYPDGRP